ncbi:MAG: hypothetical protein HY913_16170 [Desulfomonile tiedjei]|nr:hypothetical protein [Desulfomonile tiedjei]
MKKIASVIADLFPVAVALIFVVVVILSVCHATSPLKERNARGTSVNLPQVDFVPRDHSRADADAAEALRSGEWELLVPAIVP